MEIRPMDPREAREVARLRVRMLEELDKMGGEDPRVLAGAIEAFLGRRLGSGGHFTSVPRGRAAWSASRALRSSRGCPTPATTPAGRATCSTSTSSQPRAGGGSRVRSCATWWAWPAAKAWGGCGCTPAPTGAGSTRRRALRPERGRRWSSCSPDATGGPRRRVLEGVQVREQHHPAEFSDSL